MTSTKWSLIPLYTKVSVYIGFLKPVDKFHLCLLFVFCLTCCVCNRIGQMLVGVFYVQCERSVRN